MVSFSQLGIKVPKGMTVLPHPCLVSILAGPMAGFAVSTYQGLLDCKPTQKLLQSASFNYLLIEARSRGLLCGVEPGSSLSPVGLLDLTLRPSQLAAHKLLHVFF